MDEYMHLVIHHVFFSEGDDESSYGGSIAEVKCDVDKWGYFEVLGIVKELGYEESGTVIYKDPIVGLFTLSDDKGSQEIVYLCKVHESVHLYVQHLVSQPDYYDGPINDETNNIVKVVVNVDETEDVIRKLVEDVLNGKAYGVSDLNKAEVEGTNIDVNGAEHMSEGEGEVGDNNVNVNGDKDMSDSDDVSFHYDSSLDVSFQDSDEDSDALVKEDITHILSYDNDAEGKGKKHSEKYEGASEECEGATDELEIGCEIDDESNCHKKKYPIFKMPKNMSDYK
ncbi:unnamed protein product [Lathyrus oleraceus]